MTSLIERIQLGGEGLRNLDGIGAPEINLTDEAGWSALHHAAAQENMPLIEQLLARGADISHRDNSGHTAEDIARFEGRLDLAGLLRASAGPGTDDLTEERHGKETR